MRVWSIDWWYDPDAAIEQLHAALDALLQRDRENPPTDEQLPASDDAQEEHSFAMVEETDTADNSTNRDDISFPEHNVRPELVARQATVVHARVYTRAQLGDASMNQSRFFDDDYSETLKRMALDVLNTQGPILEEAFAREVACAHGFQRTGGRIRQRVLDLLPHATITREAIGNFIWPGSSSESIIPFRYATIAEERRSLDEIAMPELLGLIQEHQELIASDDPALALARVIGLARLARGARERLELALELYAELHSGSQAD